VGIKKLNYVKIQYFANNLGTNAGLTHQIDFLPLAFFQGEMLKAICLLLAASKPLALCTSYKRKLL
jgi:hypothetical protein